MKVLKFGAIWCPGCLVMRPIWKRVEAENLWLQTEYYDYDEQREMAVRFRVDGGRLPTFIFLDNSGNEITRLTGEVSRERILKIIHENKDK